jgi:hypothetical protein
MPYPICMTLALADLAAQLVATDLAARGLQVMTWVIQKTERESRIGGKRVVRRTLLRRR